jgi:peptidoglycan/LPS O-acetylase OafA/YrhL
MQYRPEIDGLRAISVVCVILYHAQITILGFQPFQGGYIGVDIFFVISGYLITYIILNELFTTGSFSFKHFYERRIRRILPVLLLVMLVSLPFSWKMLAPLSFIDFSKSIIYSLGFSSNIYFYFSGQEYGAENGLLKPFLHTWSLSVEEQFYIIFPLFLFLTFKYFRKYIIFLFFIGFFISLGLSEFGSRHHPVINFYILPTRAWELIAGSILAYFEIFNGRGKKNQKTNSILSFIGLLLVIYSVYFFKQETFHPSFFTLIPACGACLIIYFSQQGTLTTRLLSNKILVGLGVISYSLYLWHYPIFSLIRYEYVFTLPLKIISIFLTLLLSILSYLFIERKFRQKTHSIFLIGIFYISLIILFIFIVNTSNKKIVYPPWEGIFDQQGSDCFGNRCEFGNLDNKKIFLIGDSTTAPIIIPLKKYAIKNNFNLITYIKGGCVFMPNFDLYHIQKKEFDKSCNNIYFQKILNEISKSDNSILILGGNYNEYLNNPTNATYISINDSISNLQNNLILSIQQLSDLILFKTII